MSDQWQLCAVIMLVQHNRSCGNY